MKQEKKSRVRCSLCFRPSGNYSDKLAGVQFAVCNYCFRRSELYG